MGLLNLYKAMAMRPHIPYRFKAEIWPNNEGPYDEDNKNRKRIEFTIKRISQPVFNLNSDNKVYFGNTAYVVPIMKFGETTLEITFEETDDMAVFKLLAGFMGNEIYKGIYGGLINIRVTQFDETMVNIVDKKTYVCRLKEHGMPSFNNNGFGNPVELTASFNVVYIMDDEWQQRKKHSNSLTDNVTDEDTHYCFVVESGMTSDQFINKLDELINNAFNQ